MIQTAESATLFETIPFFNWILL